MIDLASLFLYPVFKEFLSVLQLLAGNFPGFPAQFAECQIPQREKISKKPLKLKEPRRHDTFSVIKRSLKNTVPVNCRAARLYLLLIYWNGTALITSNGRIKVALRDKPHLASSTVNDREPACTLLTPFRKGFDASVL